MSADSFQLLAEIHAIHSSAHPSALERQTGRRMTWATRAVAFADPEFQNASLPRSHGHRRPGASSRNRDRADDCFEGIIGKSPAIKKVLEQVAIVAPTDATVLLHGETGTGKELVANAIHNLSCRRGRALVRMNCAAIPSGLLESELFGHEKGAFTGALIQKKGRFELADRGSLFLG